MYITYCKSGHYKILVRFNNDIQVTSQVFTVLCSEIKCNRGHGNCSDVYGQCMCDQYSHGQFCDQSNCAGIYVIMIRNVCV